MWRSAVCSTPLGVTDLVTRCAVDRGISRAQDVLNASRRHRLGHTLASRTSSSRASVLNASRRHRLGHGGSRGPPGVAACGAQRLSASQTWSRSPASAWKPSSLVLNASRRHRLGHRAGRCRFPDRDHVLNASRRHRLGHAVLAQLELLLGLARAQRLSASQTWSRGHQ